MNDISRDPNTNLRPIPISADLSPLTRATASNQTRPRILAIGIGNEIRCDDAVGLAVAEEVRQRIADIRHVTVKTLAAGGWQLLYELEGFDRLIVVDAYFAETSRPGRVRVQQPAAVLPVRDIDAASAHLLSIPDAIALSARFSDRAPSLVGVVTIDVGEDCLTFGVGLSPLVSKAVSKAADAVMELIGTVK
jgi:hydrogenase maturation protease